MPHFDNRWLRELPGDTCTQNHPRQVHEALWSTVTPEAAPNPRLLAHSREVAELLDLDEATIRSRDWLGALSGNSLLAGMATYVTCYGGHQFGTWAGQLGDGRAIFLGEAVNAQGKRFELQLKGAGPTPYSRHADGYAVLRSSVREFLCSEAMHHLGVPTTRALSLVATGKTVIRDMFYDGHPAAETGAIVCRVAPSFTRFGHFELPAARGDTALLQKLLDFTLDRDFPDFAHTHPDERVARWFIEVCERTARLIVHWMRVGFVHGVMNTDNMSILGLTIDYGPYGWIDDFDPLWTPNTTDAAGRRYCFGRQPDIARWNLERLADALSLIAPDPGALAEGIERYDTTYDREFRTAFAAKFGFTGWRDGDDDLVETAFQLMYRGEIDMTVFFRTLGQVDLEVPDIDSLRDAFYAGAKFRAVAGELATWLQRWRQRIKSDGRPNDRRLSAMNAANPRYVLRNYLAQQAIERAEAGDMTMIDELLETLRHPYDNQPGKEVFAARRPDWARRKPGCSMLSCSS
ncbi:protein adenylyltransferase SelO [Propionivibrio limicola]|uniref:protein adenylyltransferase SelO n=1 Tax=Propionivibrio limicola TaxID=167645 RepID=UPI001290D52F|nr:YdiU family protein [Propionivibrio limicola]